MMKKKAISAILAAGMVCTAAGGGAALGAAAVTDDHMIDTTIVRHNLAGAPTVVVRLEEESQLSGLAGNAPASLIVRMDAEGNVVGSDGGSLGALTDLYADYIAGVMIPVVEIGGDAEAEKFIEIWEEELSIADMAVMSADAQALQKVRTQITGIRGIYDCTDVPLADESALYEQVRLSTLSMANVVLLTEEQSTVENVAYFQGRFKTVWTQLDGESEGDLFSIQNVVSSGTYGIVCTDFKSVYQAYRQYPERSVARISRNIAHRGLPMTAAENSVAGAQLAVEGGATHLEIDVHLTADDQVVVMHDGTIDRTTNGSGSVASMTLEQLRQYQIIKTAGGAEVDPEPIPTAEDMFRTFDGTGVVIVCENKTSDTDVLQALRPVIEKYDFWDQLVFISFDLNMLAAAHEQLPQVPTAALAGFKSRDFDANVVKYNAMNTVVDATIGDMIETDYYDSMLKDRGYMSFFWTYGTAQDCVAAMAQGVYGLTNNAAATFGERVGALWGQEGQTMARDALDYDAPVQVVVQTYAGETNVFSGKVFSWRDCGTYAEVIARYTEAEDVLYTRAFRVDYASSGGDDTGKGGCGSAINGVSCAAAGGAVLSACLGVCAFRKKRRKH